MAEIKVKKPKKEKVKVEYDVDNISGLGKKKLPVKFKKGSILKLVILLACEAIFYYAETPAINIHNRGFYMWLIVTLIIISVLFAGSGVATIGKNLKNGDTPGLKQAFKKTGVTLGLAAVTFLVMVIGGIASSKFFNASRYASVIDISEADFATEVPESENVSNIALMDTDSARIIGARAVGSLSDVVSQFEVSENYSTIDLNGAPMKVTSLAYAGFFKYMNNRKTGVPGYVLVDPVKNEAKYIKLEKPMRYVPSAYFNDNLERHVQMKYPTALIDGYHFEIDNDGNPYYICPVMTSHAGLFGAMDVKGIILCDPCTGDCDYMDVADVPNWVDRVYDGNLATRKYNWYGTLSGGYWNSVFGNKGCKVTTDDYGYKVMDGDVYVYTGVTSVNGDESNIGFVLMNSRTGKSKYFPIAGAEEHSAMSAAEGQVQNLGYIASFPSLVNVNGIPTYIMVLKDNAGLVKMYAMVNVEKYNIVATGTTQKEALASYRKLLASEGLIDAKKTASDDTPSADITIASVRYVTTEGETYVYITDAKGDVYKSLFADDETLIFLDEGDKIKVYYAENENGIRTLISYEMK